MPAITSKSLKRNNRGSNPAVRYFVIVMTVGFAFFLIASPGDKKADVSTKVQMEKVVKKSKPKDAVPKAKAPTKATETATTREDKEVKSSPSTATKKVEDNENKDEDVEEEEENVSEIELAVEDAKIEMEDAEEEEVEKAREGIMETVKTVEKTMTKVLDNLLSTLGISGKAAEEVEEEIAKELEEEVENEIEESAAVAEAIAEEELDSMVMSEINSGEKITKDKKMQIERDANHARDYLTEEVKSRVQSAGRAIKDGVREEATKIEKKVLKEKLGVEVTEDQIEDAEIKVSTKEVKENIEDTGKIEMYKLQKAVSEIEDSIEQNVDKVLGDYLRSKGMSSSQIEDITGHITQRFKSQVQSSLLGGSFEMESEVNQMEEEVDTHVEEDKIVLDRAKKMGMVSQTPTKTNKVEMIKKDLNNTTANFEKRLKEERAKIEERIANTMEQTLEKIEKEVLKSKGVEAKDDEVHELAKTETKDVLLRRRKRKVDDEEKQS